MLYTDSERALMAGALQANMRLDIVTEPFEAIVTDFGLRLGASRRVLDLGPGQCDLLDIARRAGAATLGIDNDPAVAELGRLRGHQMRLGDLRQGVLPEDGLFDGIFCRGSINLFWFQNSPDAARAFLDGLTAALKPDGWLWIVPWNKPVKEEGAEVIWSLMDDWRRANGVQLHVPDEPQLRKYSLRYNIPRTEVWTRGLEASAGSPSGGLLNGLRRWI